MARLSGPMFSLDASGKFGNSLVFSKWKGRNYARQLVIPLNPKAPKQTGVRAMMAFVGALWATISAPNKLTWDDLAETKAISAFNAFVGDALARWQMFKPPTKAYPALQSANAITTTQVLTGGQGFCTLGLTPSAAGDNWGFAIFRDSAEITAPNWNNCIAVIPANGAAAVSYTDSPLEAGTYHYRSAVFNTDGKMGTICADASQAVT
jgi:hypothetical protein